MAKHEGGCACGEVRFRMESDPLFVHCCHCTWCQRETGSAFALNAMIESDRVTVLQGDVQGFSGPSNSGRGQEFWRCPTCFTALWSYYGGAGEALSFVRVGTLDAGHDIEPDIHIYTDTKQPWVEIPDGHVAVAAYYSAKEQWPAASLQRMKTLITASDED